MTGVMEAPQVVLSGAGLEPNERPFEDCTGPLGGVYFDLGLAVKCCRPLYGQFGLIFPLRS